MQGKFGQRSTLTHKLYFTEATDFYELVFDAANEILDVTLLSSEMVCVTYKKADEFVEESASTNSILAAWVTAQARLKLYSYLEPLGDRVLYMDTGET